MRSETRRRQPSSGFRTTRWQTGADGEIGTVYRSYGYNEDTTEDDIDDAGNNLVRETDARGNVITYTVDPETSRRTGVCDRLGNRISYEYTDDGKISKITNKDANETELSHVAYGYDEFGNLRSITRNDGMGYALDYSPFRNAHVR